MAVVLAIFTWTTFNSQTSQAAKIPMSGTSGEDALITDANGESVNPNGPLYTWDHYTVSYNWQIPDGVHVNIGDTAEFELPEGLATLVDRNIPIYNEQNEQIAVFTIKAGESTGTMTATAQFDSNIENRKGTLTLHAKGISNPITSVDPKDWVMNKVGWISGRDPNNDNAPTEFTWNIAFNPDESSLTNVQVIDTLSPGQSYVPYSAYCPTGSYEGGKFIPDGGLLTPKVTVDGQKITFDFGDVDKAVNMQYVVKVDDPNAVPAKWTNNAQMVVAGVVTKEVGSAITWSGQGTGTGTAVGSVKLTKVDSEDNAILVPGATYDLLDATGDVIQSGLVTDSMGAINLSRLHSGDYSFVETSSPEGYTENLDPIPFKIYPGSTTQVQVTAQDTREVEDEDSTGSLMLIKEDAETKAPLPGAVYTLLDASGKTVTEDVTTDANGKIFLPDLESGSYTLVEKTAPEGYELDTTPIKIDITPGEVTKFTATDKVAIVDPGTGTLNLVKVDSDKDTTTLPGAVYTLKDSEGTVVKDDLTTDEKGIIDLQDLAPGTYTLVEKIAPEGYELDTTPITVTITANEATNVTAKDKAEVTPPVTEPEPTPEPQPEPGPEPGVTEPVKPGEPGTGGILEPTYPSTSMPGSTIKESLKTPSKGKYPQTGNTENTIATIIGIILAGFIVFMMYFRKHRKV